MSGRRNRRTGHDWERECARHLADALGLDVRTARQVSGGMSLGADLVTMTHYGLDMTVLGWTVECKTGEPHRVTEWMRQAEAQAGRSQLYCVVAKRSRKATGDALVYLPAAGWWEWMRPTLPAQDDGRPLIVSFDGWVQMLMLASDPVSF